MNISAGQIGNEAASPHSHNFPLFSFYFQLGLVLLLFAFLEICRAFQLQGFARAESCFIEGAREMFVNKQYIAPLLYNIPYFDKPPLFYWLIISFYKIFGIAVVYARAVSIAAAVLTVAVTAVFVKKVLSEKTAILCAIILATNIGFCEFAAIAMPDMLLCLFTNLAVFSSYMVLFENANKRNLYLFIMSFCFALGWMTKGPVAILIPGCSILISLFIFQQKPHLSFKDFILCSIIFLTVLIPWHLAVYKNYGLAAFNWLYIQGNIGRFVGQHSSYNFGHNPTYILVNLLGNFLPWTIIAIPALWQLIVSFLIPRKFTLESKFLLLLMFWILFNTLFFTLSRSNWGYYSLAIYPALAVIAAHFLISLKNRFSNKKMATVYMAVAITFFTCMLIYIFVSIPAKAKNNTFLNFAESLKDLDIHTPLFFDADLAGQYLLIDYTIFRSRHMPIYCDQIKLAEIISSPKPFVALIPKTHFDALSSNQKAKLIILENEPISWINFPGCKLINQAAPGKPIPLILLRHNIKF